MLALRPGRKDKNFIGIARNVCLYYGATLSLLHVVSEETSDRIRETVRSRSQEKLKEVNAKAKIMVVRSSNPVQTISDMSASYDLLILGTPEKDNWINVLFGGGKDKFTETAACSVLRLTIKD